MNGKLNVNENEMINTAAADVISSSGEAKNSPHLW